jgi:hypothetical protein
VAALLGLLVRSGAQVVGLARRAGASWLRVVAGSLIAAAVVAAVLMVPVSDRVPAGYWVRPDGRVVLTVGAPEDARRIHVGQPVTLQRQGLAARIVVGDAVVSATGGTATVPLQSVIAFIRTSVTTSAHTFVLSSVHWDGQPARAGAASVRLGSVSAGAWLRRQLFSSPLRTLVH